MIYSQFTWGRFQFDGISEGGIRTSLACPQLNIMFDIGHISPDRIGSPHLLLTHAHLDHSAGVPYYISQRSLQHLEPPKIFVPKTTEPQWRKILELYSELEGFPYTFQLHGLEFGQKVDFKPGFCFRPWPSFHRVPSQGYTVYETKKKLNPLYLEFSSSQIQELKRNGKDPMVELEVPLVSFSGDAKIEYVLENQDVQKSKVLFMECTYFCQKKDKARAREWGHTHLDEIAEHASFFQNEHLVLIHPSKRYSFKELRDWIQKKLPEPLLKKTTLFIPSTGNR